MPVKKITVLLEVEAETDLTAYEAAEAMASVVKDWGDVEAGEGEGTVHVTVIHTDVAAVGESKQ